MKEGFTPADVNLWIKKYDFVYDGYPLTRLDLRLVFKGAGELLLRMALAEIAAYAIEVASHAGNKYDILGVIAFIFFRSVVVSPPPCFKIFLLEVIGYIPWRMDEPANKSCHKTLFFHFYLSLFRSPFRVSVIKS